MLDGLKQQNYGQFVQFANTNTMTQTHLNQKNWTYDIFTPFHAYFPLSKIKDSNLVSKLNEIIDDDYGIIQHLPKQQLFQLSILFDTLIEKKDDTYPHLYKAISNYSGVQYNWMPKKIHMLDDQVKFYAVDMSNPHFVLAAGKQSGSDQNCLYIWYVFFFVFFFFLNFVLCLFAFCLF